MRSSVFLVVSLSMLAACKNDDGSAAAQGKTNEPTRKLAGVYPEEFKCDSVTTLDAVSAALGGAAHSITPQMTPPKGIALPCQYEVSASGNIEQWQWDADCRDGAKQRADALFAQYTADSAALVNQFQVTADAGIKPTDAGVPVRPPELASEVQVGAKGLDHHGRGLLFYDDDAPCYVRVVGPDAARRLELARLVAKNLTFANAPMTPRAMP